MLLVLPANNIIQKYGALSDYSQNGWGLLGGIIPNSRIGKSLENWPACSFDNTSIFVLDQFLVLL